MIATRRAQHDDCIPSLNTDCPRSAVDGPVEATATADPRPAARIPPDRPDRAVNRISHNTTRHATATDILSAPDAEIVSALRERHYNATLVEMRSLHDELRVLMVQPDGRGSVSFQPGQYTVLGLGNWEPRIDAPAGDVAEGVEHPDAGFEWKLTKRAYSFSSTILDEGGHPCLRRTGRLRSST